jgi:recombination protein RecA
VTFGEKHRRAGGKALDFYATHILWLAHVGRLNKTVGGVKRAYGVRVKAQVRKNKVGFPFREAEFDFLFGYGIDDVGASLDWLKEIKRLKEIDVAESGFKKYKAELESMSMADFKDETKRINKVVRRIWNEIEVDFIPTRRKYA